MSDTSQGPGWWLASDGRWYPPEAASHQAPSPRAAQPQATPPTGPPGYPPGSNPPSYGAPTYGQPTYGQPTYGYQQQPGYGYAWGPNLHGTVSGLPSVQGLAVASLVLGIASLFVCFYVTPLLGFIGLPMGIVAVRRINRGEADPSSKGLATAGIVLSSIGIAIVVIVVVVVIIAASSDSTSMVGTGAVS